MNVRINFNKIYAFIIFNFVLGLLQAWLLIALKSRDGNLDFSTIFSDGGIYFFSTSLCYSSLFTLLLTPDRNLKLGTLAFSITITSLIVVTGCALFSYPDVMRTTPLPTDPFSNYRASQIACLLTASFYAFYSATLIGMFEDRND